jgi:tetratricopeptide (TPR) repeat protein
LLLASPNPAALAAQGPAPYGEEFVRAGQQWPDGLPGRGSGTPIIQPPASQSLPGEDQAGYLRLVEVLELNGGPYAEDLAEPLAGLARHYRNVGDLVAAQRLYQRALHVVRINDGLNSSRQLPLVRELLSAYRESGETEKLDQRYEYFFRLYGQGRPPYTPMRLQATLEYLRWQREVLRQDFGRRDNRRLLDLYDLNEQLLAAIEETGTAPAFTWYRELVLSQLRNLYLVQARIAPKIEEVGLVHFNPLVGPNTGVLGQENLQESRLEGIQRTAVNRGASLLEELIARAEQEGPVAESSAKLELADWYQWNGMVTRAETIYAEVAELLRGAGEAQVLEHWLGQPRELPDNGAFWQPLQENESARRVTVRASYDVSASGQARNIVTRVAGEDDQSIARKLRRELSSTRFRPRFRDGVPEAVPRVAADYELFD